MFLASGSDDCEHRYPVVVDQVPSITSRLTRRIFRIIAPPPKLWLLTKPLRKPALTVPGEVHPRRSRGAVPLIQASSGPVGLAEHSFALSHCLSLLIFNIYNA